MPTTGEMQVVRGVADGLVGLRPGYVDVLGLDRRDIEATVTVLPTRLSEETLVKGFLEVNPQTQEREITHEVVVRLDGDDNIITEDADLTSQSKYIFTSSSACGSKRDTKEEYALDWKG